MCSKRLHQAIVDIVEEVTAYDYTYVLPPDKEYITFVAELVANHVILAIKRDKGARACAKICTK